MSTAAWTRPRVTETVTADQRIWLISDLHLGDGSPSDAFFGKDRHLMALIRRVAREGALLVVNGDALNVQQAWTLTRILRAHQELLAAMSDLARDGRLIYILGNHDQDLSLYRDILQFRVCDALHVGERVLISHGHEHDPYIGADLQGSDLATRVHHLTERYLDTWLRLPLGEFYTLPNRLLFWLTHQVAVSVRLGGEAMRHLGVQDFGRAYLEHLDYWARSNMGDPMCMMASVQRRLRDGPWPWLVCGHSHLPGLIRHGSGGYVNTGSWTFGSSQYAVWDGSDFAVRDWVSGQEYDDALYQPVLSGMLDEKDYWQWWRENYMGWLRFREGEERRGSLRRWEGTIRDHQVLAQLPTTRPALPEHAALDADVDERPRREPVPASNEADAAPPTR